MKIIKTAERPGFQRVADIYGSTYQNKEDDFSCQPEFAEFLGQSFGYESRTFCFQNAGHADNSQQTGNGDFTFKPSLQWQ